jgi:hypothetical protein
LCSSGDLTCHDGKASEVLDHDRPQSRLQSILYTENCQVDLHADKNDIMAVTMKNAVFWDVTPCRSCKSRRFREMYSLHHQSEKNELTRNVSNK